MTKKRWSGGGKQDQETDHNTLAPYEEPRIHDSQKSWASLQSSHNDSGIHSMASTTAAISNHQGENGSHETRTTSVEEEEFRPFSERAPPRRYEDDHDDDDHDHYHNEQAPLIRTGSDNSNYGEHDPTLRLQRGPVVSAARHQQAELPPLTWNEWAPRHGLHPTTWNKQTYIKAGLLATLLTLIILSFTVFRVQDHSKDILRYFTHYTKKLACFAWWREKKLQ